MGRDGTSARRWDPPRRRGRDGLVLGTGAGRRGRGRRPSPPVRRPRGRRPYRPGRRPPGGAVAASVPSSVTGTTSARVAAPLAGASGWPPASSSPSEVEEAAGRPGARAGGGGVLGVPGTDQRSAMVSTRGVSGVPVTPAPGSASATGSAGPASTGGASVAGSHGSTAGATVALAVAGSHGSTAGSGGAGASVQVREGGLDDGRRRRWRRRGNGASREADRGGGDEGGRRAGRHRLTHRRERGAGGARERDHRRLGDRRLVNRRLVRGVAIGGHPGGAQFGRVPMTRQPPSTIPVPALCHVSRRLPCAERACVRSRNQCKQGTAPARRALKRPDRAGRPASASPRSSARWRHGPAPRPRPPRGSASRVVRMPLTLVRPRALPPSQ